MKPDIQTTMTDKSANIAYEALSKCNEIILRVPIGHWQFAMGDVTRKVLQIRTSHFDRAFKHEFYSVIS